MGNICQMRSSSNEDSLENSLKDRNGKNNLQSNFIISAPFIHRDSQVDRMGSYAEKHDIGAYFCGGSVQQERMTDSENTNTKFYYEIIQKSNDKQAKGKESQKLMQNKISTSHQIDSQQYKNLELYICKNIRQSKLKSKIRTGPPIRFRWVSWKSHLTLISSPESLENTKSIFAIAKCQTSHEAQQIDKDLERTFPEQAYFRCTQRNANNTPIVDSIKGYKPLKKQKLIRIFHLIIEIFSLSVLSAISVIYPKLGYCQGMNFILGFILLVNGASESEAFWMFKILAEHPDFMWMGLFEDSLPLLRFLEYLSMTVLRDNHSDFLDFLVQEEIEESFWLTKWFMTMFLYNFPAKICARFWDYIITSSVFGIISLIDGLLFVFKKHFMKGNSFDFLESFSQITQDEKKLTNPKDPLFLNFADVVKNADKCNIKKSRIAKLATQFIEKDPKNVYADLYSYYDNKKIFQEKYDTLIKDRVQVNFQMSRDSKKRDERQNEEQMNQVQDEMKQQAKQTTIEKVVKHQIEEEEEEEEEDRTHYNEHNSEEEQQVMQFDNNSFEQFQSLQSKHLTFVENQLDNHSKETHSEYSLEESEVIEAIQTLKSENGSINGQFMKSPVSGKIISNSKFERSITECSSPQLEVIAHETEEFKIF